MSLGLRGLQGFRVLGGFAGLRLGFRGYFGFRV